MCWFRASIADGSTSDFVECWQTNCLGAYICCKQVLNDMAASKYGTIILTGDQACYRGGANFSNLVSCNNIVLVSYKITYSLLHMCRLLASLVYAHCHNAWLANTAQKVFTLRLWTLTELLTRTFHVRTCVLLLILLIVLFCSSRARRMFPNRKEEDFIKPTAVADVYWNIHLQHPSTWTLELDVRVCGEKF